MVQVKLDLEWYVGPALTDALLEAAPANPELAAMLNTAWLHKPMFTLRGGTNEVLRGVIARGMGLR